MPKSSKFNPNTEQLAKWTKAISHPARILILKELAKSNTCICGEIVEVLPLAQSTVSQHLKELKKAGLIKGRINGVKSCYCLNDSELNNFKIKLNELFTNLNPAKKAKRRC